MYGSSPEGPAVIWLHDGADCVVEWGPAPAAQEARAIASSAWPAERCVPPARGGPSVGPCATAGKLATSVKTATKTHATVTRRITAPGLGTRTSRTRAPAVTSGLSKVTR